MIAQIAKYNDQQLITAANCFLTNYQQKRLTRECNRSLVLSAVLTMTALAEADFDSLSAEVGLRELNHVAVERSMITAEQVEHVHGQQIENYINGYLVTREKVAYQAPTLGNPVNAIFEESIITEAALLTKLQLLFGEGMA